MIKNINKSEKATQSLLYRSIFFINKIPDYIRLYNPKKFSKYYNHYILQNLQNNNVPKTKFNKTKIPIKMHI